MTDEERKAQEAEEAKALAKKKAEESGEFNEAQQAKANLLVESAHNRGKAEGVKEQSDKISSLETQLAELQKAKGDENKSKADIDVEEMQNTIADLKRQNEQGREQSINSALLTAITTKHNVVNPSHVAELLRPHIKVDDNGNLTVQGKEGAIKYNAKGSPMTVDEYIDNWLKESPHMVRAEGSGGSGSDNNGHQQKGEKTMTRDEFSKLSPAKQKEVATSGEIKVVDNAA